MPNVHFRPYDGSITRLSGVEPKAQHYCWVQAIIATAFLAVGSGSSFLEFSEQSEHSGACDHRAIVLHPHALNVV
jgi:hypothetical protein